MKHARDHVLSDSRIRGGRSGCAHGNAHPDLQLIEMKATSRNERC